MERLLGYDWSFYIGSADIFSSDTNEKYTILVGYVGSSPGLYVRFYDKNNKFIAGDWVEYLHNRQWFKQKDGCISEDTVLQCIEQARLLEELKIFS